MRSQSFRPYVEVSPDVFVAGDQIALNPAHLGGAADMVRKGLREVLSGLAPLMGQDTLLKPCREVIEDDR